MNAEPDSVWSTVLSRSSRSCWTCGASSEPNAAVAIKQPPILTGGSDSGSGFSLAIPSAV